MAFENIFGQQRVKNFFDIALKSERLSHAYLFVGDRGLGKEAMALELARTFTMAVSEVLLMVITPTWLSTVSPLQTRPIPPTIAGPSPLMGWLVLK